MWKAMYCRLGLLNRFKVAGFVWVFIVTLVVRSGPVAADDTPSGHIVRVAGTEERGLVHDGMPALEARLSFGGIFVDADKNIYISFDHKVFKISAQTGRIFTIAGTGKRGSSGDGGPATQAVFDGPWGVFLDVAGNLFIVDRFNHRIRRVDAHTGIITTVAGTEESGFSGDDGPATRASLDDPRSVFVDTDGNLFIADMGNHRIRRVDTHTGIITTVAGNGKEGFSGDGGPATQTSLRIPHGVFLDAAGNLFIADTGNYRIRRVDAHTGIITTVAGIRNWGFSGDGGPAIQASLDAPRSVFLDAAGNLFIACSGSIRKVDSAGIISTVAGKGMFGLTDNGVLATQIRLPVGVNEVFVDVEGNLYVRSSGWVHKVVDIAAPTLLHTGVFVASGLESFTDRTPPMISLDFDPTPGDQAEKARIGATPGAQYTLELNLHNAFPINGWSATLEYDPAHLRYVRDTFRDAGFVPGLTTRVDDQEGVVSIGGSAQGKEIGIAGSGTLASLKFQVLANFQGHAPVHLTEFILQPVEGDFQVYPFQSTAHILGPKTPFVFLDFDLRVRNQREWVQFEVEPGQVHEVELHMFNAPALKGWSVRLEYNPEHLRFVDDSFEPGSFLPDRTFPVDAQDSAVVVGGAILGQATKSGQGHLGTLSFEVLDGFVDQTQVRITEVITRHPDGRVEVDAAGYAALLVASSRAYFPSAVEEDRTAIALPQRAQLLQNFPNPFNASTTLRYQLGQAGPVRLDLFDMSGQRIRTLVQAFQSAGFYTVSWDGANQQGQPVSTGLYLLWLQAEQATQTRKLLLVK
jgi:DNA-binding beta-propeller fold protein YncE